MIGRMKATSLLLIAGGLPTVFGGWYSHETKCPSSAPTLPITGDRYCAVSRDKCSTSSDVEIKFKDGPSTCTPGEDITIKVKLIAKHGESTRYDYSMWVPSTLSSSEDSPFEGAQCAVTVFPCEEGGDGDSCGDLVNNKNGRRNLSGKKHSEKKGRRDDDDKHDHGKGQEVYHKDDDRKSGSDNDKDDNMGGNRKGGKGDDSHKENNEQNGGRGHNGKDDDRNSGRGQDMDSHTGDNRKGDGGDDSHKDHDKKNDNNDHKGGDRKGSRGHRRGLGIKKHALGQESKLGSRLDDSDSSDDNHDDSDSSDDNHNDSDSSDDNHDDSDSSDDNHDDSDSSDDNHDDSDSSDDNHDDSDSSDDRDDDMDSYDTETTSDEFELTVPCRAGDDGYLALPVCLSWDEDDKNSCSDPQFAPSDECSCGIIKIDDVDVCKPNGEVCEGPFDDSCCHACVEKTYGSKSYICDDEGASGDPHLVGFRGQKFDFTGADGGHYALLAQDDPLTLVTMRVQAPVPGLNVITYIVGFGVKATDLDGRTHTVQAFVEDSKDFYAHRECPNKNEPCLAEGALTVLFDGEPVTRPGTYQLGPGFEVGAVNLPGECRSFGFEKYWARKVREANQAAALASGAGDGRKLESWAAPMDEWVLGDSKVTNRVECEDYVTRSMQEDSLFDYQSEYVSFQISTPTLTVRVNHGKLHQLAMRDPTDQFDLPDHRTFQQNIAFERVVLGAHPRGILGETVRPTRDASGEPITHGIEAMRGEEEDYRVSGPFMDDFAMGLDISSRVVEAKKAVGTQGWRFDDSM